MGRVAKLGSFPCACWLKPRKERSWRGKVHNEKRKQLHMEFWRMSVFTGEQVKSSPQRRRRSACIHSLTHLVSRDLWGTYHGHQGGGGRQMVPSRAYGEMGVLKSAAPSAGPERGSQEEQGLRVLTTPEAEKWGQLLEGSGSGPGREKTEAQRAWGRGGPWLPSPALPQEAE